MSVEILRKVVAELQQSEPRIQYLLGMCETLLAMTDTADKTPAPAQSVPKVTMPVPHSDPEVDTIESHALANLDIIKQMATSHD